MESIGCIFRKNISKKNLITPEVIDYVKQEKFIVELSKSSTSDRLKGKVAVTIWDTKLRQNRHDLNLLCHSEEHARNYIKGLL